MNAADLLTTIKRYGATLYLDGDRLRLRAPDGFPSELREQAKAQRDELIGLLRNWRQTPRDHFMSLADGYEEQGITGRLGSVITGELWLAVQRWEQAIERQHHNADDLEHQYWDVWRRHFPDGSA